MKKLRGLIGMTVVCHRRRIGRVLQAELSEDLTRLGGIWIGAGLRGTRFIPSEELQMLGQAAILADSLGERRRMNRAPLFHRAISTDGARLGAVIGAEIDELSFAVRALELSRGFWDDLLRTRQYVKRYSVNRHTGEIVVDLSTKAEEAFSNEGWNDQGPDYRHADWISGGNGVWRDELADRAQVEPKSPHDGQLDLRQSG